MMLKALLSLNFDVREGIMTENNKHYSPCSTYLSHGTSIVDEAQRMKASNFARDFHVCYCVCCAALHFLNNNFRFPIITSTNKTSMSRPAPPYAATALALSVKHWKDLGIDDGDEETAPTNDLDTLVERLTAILVVRCVAIVAEKDEFNDLSTATICRSTLMRQASWPEPITADVVEQIRTFVHAILSRYNDNPYHNREHAYHVTTSAHKLLELMLLEKQQTFGLRNDPLMQFALIFAALIHDVEHQGLPNRQLCNEAVKLAVTYNDQSVAENRSLAIGFHELLKEDYTELRAVLFGNSNETDPSQSDYQKFRRQVISLVLTTDIANPERTALFKSKWVEAFESPLVDDDVSVLGDDDEKKDHKEGEDEEEASESRDVLTSDKVGERRRSNASTGSLRSRGSSRGGTRLGVRMSIDLSGEALHIYKQVGNSKNSEEPDELKISVLLELFLTAADVSHNLQGWEQMVKWSNCLYLELQRALLMGRGTDPKPNWFQNQVCSNFPYWPHCSTFSHHYFSLHYLDRFLRILLATSC